MEEDNPGVGFGKKIFLFFIFVLVSPSLPRNPIFISENESLSSSTPYEELLPPPGDGEAAKRTQSPQSQVPSSQ